MPRPPNDQAREQLRRVLAARGPTAPGELARALNVSGPSVYRMLVELGPQVLTAGRTRQRRCALRRTVRGAVSELPLFSVDTRGHANTACGVAFVQPRGCHSPLESVGWPELPGQEGWWDGLPYPMYDMRLQGYLGRRIARVLAPQLHVSENPDEWSDDDIVMYLAQYGVDQAGNLIMGEQAMQQWTRERTHGLRELIAPGETAKRYSELAQEAVGLGAAGSSAGGEFPKFTAARDLRGSVTPHVIVKFSGADNSPAVRRWADLLVCEHLALDALARAGHQVARSRVLEHEGRTFLESERFDRHGDFGRSATVSLSSLEAALIGGGAAASWPAVLRSPAAHGLFPGGVIERVEELHWFGRFIANTDMHHGNLSFRPEGERFALAPAYDMLPMHYAPLRGGEVPSLEFPAAKLPPPPAGREGDWQRMLHSAIGFWGQAAGDARISEGFREICAANVGHLQRFAEVWGSGERDLDAQLDLPPRG